MESVVKSLDGGMEEANPDESWFVFVLTGTVADDATIAHSCEFLINFSWVLLDSMLQLLGWGGLETGLGHETKSGDVHIPVQCTMYKTWNSSLRSQTSPFTVVTFGWCRHRHVFTFYSHTVCVLEPEIFSKWLFECEISVPIFYHFQEPWFPPVDFFLRAPGAGKHAGVSSSPQVLCVQNCYCPRCVRVGKPWLTRGGRMDMHHSSPSWKCRTCLVRCQSCWGGD